MNLKCIKILMCVIPSCKSVRHLGNFRALKQSMSDGEPTLRLCALLTGGVWPSSMLTIPFSDDDSDGGQLVKALWRSIVKVGCQMEGMCTMERGFRKPVLADMSEYLQSYMVAHNVKDGDSFRDRVDVVFYAIMEMLYRIKMPNSSAHSHIYFDVAINPECMEFFERIAHVNNIVTLTTPRVLPLFDDKFKKDMVKSFLPNASRMLLQEMTVAVDFLINDTHYGSRGIPCILSSFFPGREDAVRNSVHRLVIEEMERDFDFEVFIDRLNSAADDAFFTNPSPLSCGMVESLFTPVLRDAEWRFLNTSKLAKCAFREVARAIHFTRQGSKPNARLQCDEILLRCEGFGITFPHILDEFLSSVPEEERFLGGAQTLTKSAARYTDPEEQCMPEKKRARTSPKEP